MSLRDDLTALQATISPLHARIETLASKFNALLSPALTDSTSAIRQALHYSKSLLEFLQATKNPTPKQLGELLSHLAHLFGRFSVAEGVTSEQVQSITSLITDIEAFDVTTISPLLASIAELKTRSQASSDGAGARVNDLRTELTAIETEAENKTISIMGTEAELLSIRRSVEALRSQLSALEDEKRALERKAAVAKERQRAQGTTAAAGFFSLFAPVFAPMAMTGGAFALIANDQIKEVESQMTGIKHQLSAVDFSALEATMCELRAEHRRFLEVARAKKESVFEAETEAAFAGNTCVLVTAVDDEVEALVAEMEKLREEVASGRERLERDLRVAQTAKFELAQAIVTTCRMEFSEAKAYVLAPVRTSLKLLDEEEEADGCRALLEEITKEVDHTWREGTLSMVIEVSS